MECLLMIIFSSDAVTAGISQKLPDCRITTSYCLTSDKPPDSSERVTEVNGRWWHVREGQSSTDYAVAYIGSNNRTLSNLMLAMSGSLFYLYSPVDSSACLLDRSSTNKSLMKRYYLIEKAKDAHIIGLLFGTMSVRSYGNMHDRLRQLITKAG